MMQHEPRHAQRARRRRRAVLLHLRLRRAVADWVAVRAGSTREPVG